MSFGDLTWKGEDSLETYFDTLRQGVGLPRRKWIVKPDFVPPAIPGMEKEQKEYECNVIPRKWQLLRDLWTKLQCGTYFVKQPNWIEPPITARCIDERTETACNIVGISPPSPFYPYYYSYNPYYSDPYIPFYPYYPYYYPTGPYVFGPGGAEVT